ncbi:hypothetical protein BDZ89DRAFT_1066472 [Hymenopellis radicata]|nr:hypothetical protein BDZ89DRAFT_1066472 [Hymenopellis radicata]
MANCSVKRQYATGGQETNLHTEANTSPLFDSCALQTVEGEATAKTETDTSPCTIDDLPFEILQTIFTEACANDYIWINSESSPFSHIPVDDLGEDPLPFDVPSESYEPFPMTLLRVSSRWRAVGCATSSIWGAVALTLSRAGPFPDPQDTSCPAWRRLDRVLGYARGAAMHVICQGWMGNAYTVSLCARLFRTSNQWEIAHLHLNGLPTVHLVDALKGELALLQVLDLYLGTLWPLAEEEKICEAFRVAPRLTDVQCTYGHWELHGKVYRNPHLQYLRRSLERSARNLEVLFIDANAAWPPLILEAGVDTTLSGILPSVRNLALNDEHTPTLFTCPSLTHLTIYPLTRYNSTPLEQAVSMLERSCCSLTSLSMHRLRPMEPALIYFRRILMLSPELETLSIVVDRRESRRINRVLRLMLEFMKGLHDKLKKLRCLMIETVARNTPTSFVHDPRGLCRDETLDVLRSLFAAYLPAPSIQDLSYSSRGFTHIVSHPRNFEMDSAMDTTAFRELENCEKGSLAVVLKFSQFDGSERSGLYAGPG